jgi:hypothetical protein
MAFTKNLLLVAVTLLAVFAVSDAAFCEHPGPFDPRTAYGSAPRCWRNAFALARASA